MASPISACRPQPQLHTKAHNSFFISSPFTAGTMSAAATSATEEAFIPFDKLDVNRLVYGQSQRTKYGASFTVPVKYDYGGTRGVQYLQIRTPKMRTYFGISKYTSKDTEGRVTYSIDAGLDGVKSAFEKDARDDTVVVHVPSNESQEAKDGVAFYNTIDTITKHHMQKVADNAATWFNSKKKWDYERVKLVYHQPLKVSEKNADKYSPLMKLEVDDRSTIYILQNGNRVRYRGPLEGLVDAYPKQSSAVFVIRATSLWFNGSQCGFKWRIAQALVIPRETDTLERCVISLKGISGFDPQLADAVDSAPEADDYGGYGADHHASSSSSSSAIAENFVIASSDEPDSKRARTGDD